MENWRPIPGYPLYIISDAGNVMTLLSNQPLKPDKSSHGYPRVRLNGKRFSVHRLVMLTFISPCPDGQEINHKNGIVDDSRLENLEYVTKKYNQWHCNHVIKTRTSQKGSKHGRSILTEKEVIAIRLAYTKNKRQVTIASKFGVSVPTVSMIVNRKIWRHI